MSAAVRRLALAGCLLGLGACKSRPEDRAGASAQPVAAKAEAAPLERFDVSYDLPPQPGAPKPEPPASALLPWRVWVSQERPRQKKNPHWQVVRDKEGVALELANDGHFRCVLGALRISAQAESEKELHGWTALRKLRCSSDGWRTFSEARLVIGLSPEGTVTLPPEPNASLLLHDRVNGEMRETAVALAFGESDAAAAAATKTAIDGGAHDGG